jgi:hypothetical protein
MKLAVSQILKRSAALALLACIAGAMAFAQITPDMRTAPQHNNPGPPSSPTQNVVVVNGAGQPVPTTAQGTTNVAGTVNVGNSPNVNVANTPNVNVANTPSVNVTNTPTVQLTNPPSSPIPTWALDEPGRIPFVAYFSNSCSGTGCDYTFLPVRAGHRVVLQHISASLVFTTAPTALFGAVDGSFGAIFFNVPPPPGGLNLTSFDHALLLYFDAGQTPLVQINTNGQFDPSAGQNLALVGYELDCSAAPCAAITNQ